MQKFNVEEELIEFQEWRERNREKDLCTNRGVSFPKRLDNLFIKKWIHDVDIYVFLVTGQIES